MIAWLLFSIRLISLLWGMIFFLQCNICCVAIPLLLSIFKEFLSLYLLYLSHSLHIYLLEYKALSYLAIDLICLVIFWPYPIASSSLPSLIMWSSSKVNLCVVDPLRPAVFDTLFIMSGKLPAICQRYYLDHIMPTFFLVSIFALNGSSCMRSEADWLETC